MFRIESHLETPVRSFCMVIGSASAWFLVRPLPGYWFSLCVVVGSVLIVKHLVLNIPDLWSGKVPVDNVNFCQMVFQYNYLHKYHVSDEPVLLSKSDLSS